MNSKEVITRLQAQGWQLVRIKGSHHQFTRPGQPGRVTVKATLNKFLRTGAPGLVMGCEGERRGSKAACAALDSANGPGLWPGRVLQGQSAAIPGGIASICNDADRPKPGCDSREGLVQRRLKPPDSDIPAGTLRSIEKQAGWR